MSCWEKISREEALLALYEPLRVSVKDRGVTTIKEHANCTILLPKRKGYLNVTSGQPCQINDFVGIRMSAWKTMKRSVT